MTIVALQPRPGIRTDEAQGANGDPLSFVSGNLVRFVDGKAETIGGWQARSGTLSGKVRALISSAQLDGTRNIFSGSHTHLELLQGGAVYDITPVAGSAVALSADPIDTVNGDETVTVSQTAHGLVVGQRVIIAGATDTGGLVINGEHTINEVPGPNSFTYEAATAATATATGGGGSVTSQALLPPGEPDGTYEYGWGVGPYSGGTYGTARSSSDIELAPRVWSLAAYGEDLLATPGRQNTIYRWDATSGTGSRAVALSGAPNCEFLIVAPQSRHLISFGADNDPMLIKWCAQGSLTDWTPSSINDAGDIRLLDGSEIRSAQLTKNEIVVWTDTAAYSLRYVGGEFVFSLTKLADAAPILGRNAAATAESIVAWMSDGQFQFYDGVVRQVPCPVLGYVFDKINLAQRAKIHAFSNAEFGEIGWFYCSEGATEIDRVVVWAYTQGPDVWWIGELSRTAYIDRGIELQPIAVDAGGTVFDHEIPGAGDNGSAVAYRIRTGGVFVGEGEDLFHIRQAIPDTVLVDSDISNALSLQFFARIYPQGAEVSDTANSIISTTEHVDTRITGRQIAWQASSNSAQLQWRLGRMRFDVQQLDAAR